MDQQQTEQPARRPPGFQPGNRHGFAPGVSGNPRGRRSIKGEAQRIIDVFVRRHGRAPDGVEAAIIGNAALLRIKMVKKHLKLDTIAKLNNAYDRCIRRLGLGKTPVVVARSAVTPLPSAAEMIAANKVRTK
jgi:hypothetical protein